MVEKIDYGAEEITLPDIPQANPSAADLRRDARDRAKLGKIFTRRESVARFTAELAPASALVPYFVLKFLSSVTSPGLLTTGWDCSSGSPDGSAVPGIVNTRRGQLLYFRSLRTLMLSNPLESVRRSRDTSARDSAALIRLLTDEWPSRLA
jgi:hypothetical protein